MQRGCLLALTGKASDAVETITSGVTAMQSTGATMWMPLWLSYLTRANAEIGQFDNGEALHWRSYGRSGNCLAQSVVLGIT